jgi:hypothetical protein
MKLKNMLRNYSINGIEIPEAAEPSYTEEHAEIFK